MKYNNSKRIIYLPLIIAISLIIGASIGWLYYGNSNANTSSNHLFIYPRTDKINNILNYIESYYVDPVSKEDIIENTIPKILSDLDPHSIYIPASDFNTVNESLEGNFSGIGIQFNMTNDTVIVITTIPNGPSEKIGVQAGDRIVFVDGDTIAGVNMPSNDVVKRLKGPKGTKVEVGIKRPSVEDIIYFDITRDDIPLYSVDVAYMIDDSIGFIKISTFASTTFEEFVTNYKRLEEQGMHYLILDLRDNSGGYLGQATQIADQFLTKDKLIVYTEGRNSPRSEMHATQHGIALDMPVGILINEGSASASEILAGALQDNDRAVIIGRRSYGKGLVQEQRKLSDGSAIRLTIARYHTPTGRCIQKSYENGLNEYYNDLTHRFLNGEFLSADSIHFSDSLKYETPGGNIVYGGGGIMPDYFIPLDTNGVTPFYSEVRNKGLIYRFAFLYTDMHREELQQSENLADLLSHLIKKNIFNEFLKFAKKNGINTNLSEAKTSKEIINTQLNAYIARNIFDNEGFYPVIGNIDETLIQATTIIKNESR